MTKKSAILMTLALLILFPSAAALADVTHFWSFSTGLDSANFTSGNNTDNFKLITTGGNLDFTKGAAWTGGYGPVQGGSVSSNFYLHGNFDITVDSKSNTDLGPGVQIQINEPYQSMVRENRIGTYHVWNGGFAAATTTSDFQSGILQIVRTGSTAYFSYYDDGAWNTIYSQGIGTEDMQFSLSVMDNAYDGGAGVPFDVSFYNLTVTAQSTPRYVPLPGAVWLLGSGLLGLGGWRRFRKS
jgi:hypothetical protein